MYHSSNGSIDVFDREYFESCLPRRKSSDAPLWLRSFQDGEYVYRVSMDDPNKVAIHVSSTVNTETGLSDDTGENSIKLWLVTKQGYPLGHKLVQYITREAGWEQRMLKQMAFLRQRRQRAGNCPICGDPNIILRVVQIANAKHGSVFAKCMGHLNVPWVWLVS